MKLTFYVKEFKFWKLKTKMQAFKFFLKNTVTINNLFTDRNPVSSFHHLLHFIKFSCNNS